jgi:hypothetical protein
MKIIRPVWSHESIREKKKYINRDVRLSDFYEIRSFRSLVRLMAEISFKNPDWSLFFRGQTNEYMTKKQLTSIYPSIYRSSSGLLIRMENLKLRFERLENAENYLLNELSERNLPGVSRLKQFREMRWAILQHYEVCETPLLDITNNLRVACSFALNKAEKRAHLYVFGFPHVNGSISYYVEEEMLNIKLLSICPPRAMRPYYQEGYLAGTFPIDESMRSVRFDVARRLVAKFVLIKKKFWDSDFPPMPDQALYPQRDPVKLICERIKQLI